MRGQLYCGQANSTALFCSPVVSALSSDSDNPDDPGSSPSRGKVLCPWEGLAKSIYYFICCISSNKHLGAYL